MASPTGADSTSERIVAAAVSEFSRHGIAGARIERIASAAKTSKERVYAYFSSKEDLYRCVAGRELAAVAKATEMDPTNLPDYAARVHDYFTRHPERLRLMNWGQLELMAGLRPDDPVQESLRYQVEQLHAAQEAGYLDPAWDPRDIAMFVNQIATSWAATPELAPESSEDRDAFMAEHRSAIVAAVRQLFPAASGGTARLASSARKY